MYTDPHIEQPVLVNTYIPDGYFQMSSLIIKPNETAASNNFQYTGASIESHDHASIAILIYFQIVVNYTCDEGKHTRHFRSQLKIQTNDNGLSLCDWKAG